MNYPAILLGSLFAIFYGSIFHVWKGGGIARYAFYLGLSLLGFWVFNWLGGMWDWRFLAIGEINLGAATLGSILTLGIGFWLSQIKPGMFKLK